MNSHTVPNWLPVLKVGWVYTNVCFSGSVRKDSENGASAASYHIFLPRNLWARTPRESVVFHGVTGVLWFAAFSLSLELVSWAGLLKINFLTGL